MKPKLLTVGKVANTHGIRGELKVWPETDFPEQRFKAGNELLLVSPDESVSKPLVVAAARPQKNVYLVKFKEFDDINQVEPYKGWSLKVSAEQRAKLDRDEFYFHDIIGCAVKTEEGEDVGVVTDILRPGANDVWVVKRTNGKSAYLPYIADVVVGVDVPAKLVTIRLMEGLLE
ncbi:ribosome maturation factor RimM [Paenibacillus sp.]|uniref:ribosome maturation factor RimM n=1 Tax=Paenibacillus sp. TaxID=58172 RepID=UPI002D6FEF3C|nr:ribosome maturation factor RimM [Paenibacillus sp.]HZG58685.1 ribosome maturation factor RimM [Paenibacillus sp.]